MTDRRTIKTKKAIHQAFIELLQNKPLNKITVAELSKNADLGRGTFYLHYRDIYDLYARVENDLLAGLLQTFKAFAPYTTAENVISLTDGIIEYVGEHKELFLLFMQANENGNVMYKIKEIFSREVLEDECYHEINDFERLEALFLVSGMIGVLEEWISGTIELPKERVSSILRQLLLKFD